MTIEGEARRAVAVDGIAGVAAALVAVATVLAVRVTLALALLGAVGFATVAMVAGAATVFGATALGSEPPHAVARRGMQRNKEPIV
jgi:hypothetical protein